MRRTWITLVSCLFVIGSLASTVGAVDWVQFRGPGGQGVSEATDLPTTWSQTENLVWKRDLPGSGASSPIALNGKLYLTCYSGYGMYQEGGKLEDLTLHLTCLDGRSGRILWDKSFKAAQPESKKVRDHGYAAQTPATDGEYIYVFFGRSGVFKFDLAGNQIWKSSVGTKTHGWGSGSSPVLYKNLVIVNASVESNALVALDKVTGDEVWRVEGMQRSWSTPHLVTTRTKKQEIVVSVKSWLLGIEPATGKELWRCESIPDYICPSLVSHKGIVYAMGGRTSKAIAIMIGGRGDVTKTHRLWVAGVGANVSSPVVYEGHLYWTSDRNKKSYCLSLDDATLKYEENIKLQPYASTLAADGKLYVVTRDKGTLVLAAQPNFKKLALNAPLDKTKFDASPIVYDGKLILRSNKALYCLGL